MTTHQLPFTGEQIEEKLSQFEVTKDALEFTNDTIQETGCLAGLKGFYWTNIAFVNTNAEDSEVMTLHLSTVNGNYGIEQEFDITQFWSVNDIISIHSGNKYINCTTIKQIVNSHCIEVYCPKGIGFTKVSESEHVADNAVYVLSKPTAGLCDFGQFSVAMGDGCQAINYATVSMGRDNKSVGQYGATFGRQNEAGYCSLTAGRKNTIFSDHTISAGTNNTSEALANANLMFGSGNTNHSPNAKRSLVGGENNHNYSVDSAVFGTGNTNKGEDSLVSGSNNTNSGARSIIGGQSSENSCTDSIVIGNTVTNTEYGNTSIVVGECADNTGYHSAVFGGGTSDKHSTNSASFAIVAGQGLENTGGRSAVFGQNNTNSGSHSLIGGHTNNNSGGYSLVVGLYNNNQGENSILAGQGKSGEVTNTGKNCLLVGNALECKTNGTILIGQTNKSLAGANSAVFGGKNTNCGYNNLIVGANNSVFSGYENETFTNANFCFVAGEGNHAKRDYQTLVGKYAYVSENTLFAIGNGSSDGMSAYGDYYPPTYSNAFEVLQDGTAKLGDKTVTTNDYVDTIVKGIGCVALTINANTSRTFAPSYNSETGQYKGIGLYCIYTGGSSATTLTIYSIDTGKTETISAKFMVLALAPYEDNPTRLKATILYYNGASILSIDGGYKRYDTWINNAINITAPSDAVTHVSHFNGAFGIPFPN